MNNDFDHNQFISEMIEIEDTLYELIENGWYTLEQISLEFSQLNCTLNGIRLDGPQCDKLVEYFFLDYYRKYQKHYHEPDFREKYLNPIEQMFPERKFQIAVAKHPHDNSIWRVRKRLFKRLRDRI